MATPPTNPPMTLSPATPSDIPDLAHIHVIALRPDGAAALKFNTEDEFQSKVEDMLRQQIRPIAPPNSTFPSPKPTAERAAAEPPTGATGPELDPAVDKDEQEQEWYVTKATLPADATNTEPGTIAGWASWQLHRGGASDDAQPPQKQDHHQHSRSHPQRTTANAATPPRQPSAPEEQRDTNDPTFSFPPGLGRHVSAHTYSVFTAWNTRRGVGASATSPTPQSKPYLSLRAHFVHPHHRRQGIGSRLVSHGSALADRLGLRTVVQASPMGKGVYERAGGFRVFDRLEIELSEWMTGAGESLYVKNGLEERYRGSGKGEGEGVYCFWYLERHPQR